MTIDLTVPCRILVGINESGKSNILLAMALLDPMRKPVPGDQRDLGPDEDPDQPMHVRFVFALERADRLRILEGLRSKVLATSRQEVIASYKQEELTLDQVCDRRTQGLYTVNVRTGKRHGGAWSIVAPWSISDGWFKPSTECPPAYSVTAANGDEVILKTVSLIHQDLLTDTPEGYIQKAALSDLSQTFANAIAAYVEENLPTTIFWSYSEEQLLPGQIPLGPFTQDPDECAPLKHMFELAGFSDAADAISTWSKRPNGQRNLFNRVAERATKHMHAVWRESKDITIELAVNGSNIEANIKDRYNLFDLARRSDGFKRFLSFLLLVSARVKSGQLENVLYLHDEPDVSLHPAGARYLRDELIKMSKVNYVLFSTHSIFMIDRDMLERHLIVEKRNEITTIRDADESNVVDEEVLYNALGASIFEILRPKNIVFEGWRDKKLFEVGVKALSSKHKALKDQLSEVGVCHAKGVKDIRHITPLLELAGRKWIVVSDSDRPSAEQKRQYHGAGAWYMYSDLLPGEIVVTGEDFIKPDTVRVAALKIGAEYSGLGPLTVEELAGDSGKMAVLNQWLQRAGLSGEEVRTALDGIKGQLFDNLKPSHLEEKHSRFLQALGEVLSE